MINKKKGGLVTHSLSVSKEDSGLAMDSPRSFIVMMKTS